MPRKRKRRGRRLSIYKVFGLHCLLFFVVIIAVNLLSQQFFYTSQTISGYGDSFTININPLRFITLSWIPLLYLHLAYVILITIDRLLRRLFAEESVEEERLADQLLQEVADLRLALQQRAAADSSAPGRTAGRRNRRPRSRRAGAYSAALVARLCHWHSLSLISRAI